MQDSHRELREEIAEVLRATIKKPVAVQDNTNIVRDLGLDSLAVMNFCMALEERFDISIPLDRIAEVETVGDLVRTVEELREGARV